MKNAYLAIKFHENNGNKKLIEDICQSLEEAGIQTVVMARDYDINKMAEVVKNIKELYPDLSIINYSLPGATEIAGTNKMNFPTPIWFALVRECETFIVVDSSLQHMSAAYNKKGVVFGMKQKKRPVNRKSG